VGIYRGSRYGNVEVLQSQNAAGETESTYVIRKTTVTPPTGSIAYTTKAGDTFEKLAQKHYGDGNKWYVLADANPSVFFPLDLDSGTLIYIPPKSYAALV
jgi:nucleoid-associated protein YgaU